MYRELTYLSFHQNHHRNHSPRTESLFYVRIGNPEIKIRYIPRLKIIHEIYLRDTIIENVSGKAYLNVISTLDEEVEVQVPILHLKPLDKLFDDHESNMEMQNNREKDANIQLNPTHLEDNQIHDKIPNTNVNSKGDEDKIINNNKGTINKKSIIKKDQTLKETKKTIKNENAK